MGGREVGGSKHDKPNRLGAVSISRRGCQRGSSISGLSWGGSKCKPNKWVEVGIPSTELKNTENLFHALTNNDGIPFAE